MYVVHHRLAFFAIPNGYAVARCATNETLCDHYHRQVVHVVPAVPRTVVANSAVFRILFVDAVLPERPTTAICSTCKATGVLAQIVFQKKPDHLFPWGSLFRGPQWQWRSTVSGSPRTRHGRASWTPCRQLSKPWCRGVPFADRCAWRRSQQQSIEHSPAFRAPLYNTSRLLIEIVRASSLLETRVVVRVWINISMNFWRILFIGDLRTTKTIDFGLCSSITLLQLLFGVVFIYTSAPHWREMTSTAKYQTI